MSSTDGKLMELSREEAAGDWCVRLASDTLGPAERAEFDAWLEADPANSHAYDRALSVWYGLHSVGDRPELIAYRADALNWLKEEGRRRWMRPIRRRWTPLTALAACLALVFVSTLFMFQNDAQEFSTGLGERRTAVLEDGSKLSLDAQTDVSVDFEKDRRELRLLAGRAKFDVAHDASRPFTVLAAGRTIIATGTSFSVEVLKNDVRVIVYEGHVAVLDKAASQSEVRGVIEQKVTNATKLDPGLQLLATNAVQAEKRIVNADVNRSLSWEGGQLDFVDEPLSTVAERLNRYSEIRVTMNDPRVAQLPVNGVFNAGDTNAFLSAIDEAYPVAVRRNGNVATIELQPR